MVSGGWFKSSDSYANGNCLEVKFLDNGKVGVRNSNSPAGGVLFFTAEEWASFLAGCRNGEFDQAGPPASPVD